MADTEHLQAQLKELSEQVERLTYTMERGISNAAQQLPKEMKRGIDATRAEWERQLGPDAMKKMAEQVVEINIGRWRRFYDFNAEQVGKLKRMFDTVADGAKAAFDELQRVDKKYAIGATDGLTALKNSALQGVPFGGLIGLMVYGRFKSSEYTAFGEQAAQQFKRAGDVGRGAARELGSEIRKLERDYRATHGEVIAVTAAMAQMGVTDKQGRGHVIESLGVDKYFQQAAGTTAHLAAQLAQNTNKPFTETLQTVKELGFAATKMGMSFEMAAQSIAAASSALRIQQVDARQLANFTAATAMAYKSMGMTDPAAGARAASSVTSVANSIANMSDALAGYIGERTTGEKGAAAVYAFRRGALGEAGPEAFGKFVAAEVEILRKITGNRNEQGYTAMQMFGVDVTGAERLVDLANSGKSQVEISKLAADRIGDLKNAFNQEARKTSEFTRYLKNIQDAVANVGSGLMNILVSGFNQLVGLVKFAVGYLTTAETDQDKAQLKAAYMKFVKGEAKQTDTGMQLIANALSDIGLTGEKGVGALAGRKLGQSELDKVLEAITQRNKEFVGPPEQSIVDKVTAPFASPTPPEERARRRGEVADALKRALGFSDDEYIVTTEQLQNIRLRAHVTFSVEDGTRGAGRPEPRKAR